MGLTNYQFHFLISSIEAFSVLRETFLVSATVALAVELAATVALAVALAAFSIDLVSILTPAASRSFYQASFLAASNCSLAAFSASGCGSLAYFLLFSASRFFDFSAVYLSRTSFGKSSREAFSCAWRSSSDTKFNLLA